MITKKLFTEKSAKDLKISIATIGIGYKVVRCKCSMKGCEGWRLVDKDWEEPK